MSRGVPQPNERPVRTYPTPSWSAVPFDELLVERFEFNKSNGQKLPEGTPHPNVRDFPNHQLVYENYDGNYGIVTRYWANGFRNQDQYNYDITYSADSAAHPIFSRKYLVRRDQYVPFARGDDFTGVYLIEVTNEGSGYDPNDPPDVTIAGGGGSGATAKALISSDGKVKWVYLTDEGSGYTSTPTVSFSSGAATAVAKTQLSTNIVYTYEITNGGSGYTTAPLLTIVGDGSGATAVAQVSEGVIVGVMPTAYGSGYTAASVIISGGGGSNGAITANLQSVTPQLVSETIQEFPEGDPRRSLYIMVLRQYEAMPGPILIEHRYEPFIDNYVSILKSVVPKSMVPADMFHVERVAGEITEYSPITEWRYIKCVSKINTGIAWPAADTEYLGTANYTFPNEIHEDPTIVVAYAFSGADLAIDFGLDLNVLEGYSGPCPARFVRRYTFDPTDAAFQAALPEVTYIKPEADARTTTFFYSGGNIIARVFQWIIPSTLHDELEVDVEISGSGPVIDLPGNVFTVDATVPTSIPEGSEILASIKVNRWQFGLFIYDMIWITNPSPP